MKSEISNEKVQNIKSSNDQVAKIKGFKKNANIVMVYR